MSQNKDAFWLCSNCKKQFKKNVQPPRPEKNPNYEKIDNLPSKSYWGSNVHPTDPIYDEIMALIDEPSISVENLVAIDNPTLVNEYELKKQEKIQRFGFVEEKLLFHGTRKENLDSICSYNFDWRLFGTNVGNKFGQGVSFSPSAKYASEYSADYGHKVMIVAKVQVCKVCEGYPEMQRPPVGFDTSQKSDGNVIVKYEDNEFYPAYKLYFHFDDSDDYYYGDEDADYYEAYEYYYEYYEDDEYEDEDDEEDDEEDEDEDDDEDDGYYSNYGYNAYDGYYDYYNY